MFCQAKVSVVMMSNVLFLWASSLLGAAAAFCTQVILARQLGPQDYGSFSAVLAAVSSVAPLAGFGVGALWLKVFGLEGWRGIRWIRPSLRFSALSTFGIITIILLWAFLGPNDKNTVILFCIMSFYVIGNAIIEPVSACYQLEERYVSFAVFQITRNVLRLMFAGMFILIFGNNLTPVIAAISFMGVTALITLVGLAPIARILRGEILLKGHIDALQGSRKLLSKNKLGILAVGREAWPFGVAAAVHLATLQISVVLLKYLAGDSVAGIYNVAIVIIIAITLLPLAIYQKYLLPKLHRWVNDDFSKVYKVYVKGNRIMLFLGLVSMLAVLVFSPFAINLLFGTAYAGASTILQILALGLPLKFVAIAMDTMLVLQDNIRWKVRCLLGAGLCNVALSLFLIPAYGATGAAIAMLITDFLLLLLYYSCVRMFVFAKSS